MATKTKQAPKQRPYVLVRTYSAGVHCGRLVDQSADGKRVRLVDAKRIWRWYGAWTLSEIATTGLSTKSKVSAAVSQIDLTEAIEIIACSPAATACLEGASWAK